MCCLLWLCAFLQIQSGCGIVGSAWARPADACRGLNGAGTGTRGIPGKALQGPGAKAGAAMGPGTQGEGESSAEPGGRAKARQCQGVVGNGGAWPGEAEPSRAEPSRAAEVQLRGSGLSRGYYGMLRPAGCVCVCTG